MEIIISFFTLKLICPLLINTTTKDSYQLHKLLPVIIRANSLLLICVLQGYLLTPKIRKQMSTIILMKEGNLNLITMDNIVLEQIGKV